MVEISLPNSWEPRRYQLPLWSYLESGGKRAVEIAHRRWGKDDVALNWSAVSAFERVGVYWHMLPQASQARKAVWDAVNPHTGKRRIDEAFPHDIRSVTRENEMFIRFVNGSTWQVVGSDNFNALVGSPPVGVVFSEYALADPTAWAMIRPILRENGGWAVFITTPRGGNHAKTLLESARESEGWFSEVSAWTDTGVFTAEEMAAELAEYKRENGEAEGQALFDQEYGCSFEAAVIGAYYAGELGTAQKENRITSVPYDPAALVRTYWDLGLDDATAVWFGQLVGKEVRFIEYQEWTGTALTDVARDIVAKPYAYDRHVLPHDAEVREMTSAKTRRSVLEGVLGQNKVDVVPAQDVADGINAVRVNFPRMWFDKAKCERGLEALRNYRKRWDENRKTFLNTPHHDWASHGADAMRQFGLHYREAVVVVRRVTLPKLGAV